MLDLLLLKDHSFKFNSKLLLSFFFNDSHLQLQLVLTIKIMVSKDYYCLMIDLYNLHLRDILECVQFLTIPPSDECSAFIQHHAQGFKFVYLFEVCCGIDFLDVMAATS